MKLNSWLPCVSTFQSVALVYWSQVTTEVSIPIKSPLPWRVYSLVPCPRPLPAGFAMNGCVALQLLCRHWSQIHYRSITDPPQTHQPELSPSTRPPRAGKRQTGCTVWPAEPRDQHTPWKAFPARSSHHQLASLWHPSHTIPAVLRRKHTRTNLLVQLLYSPGCTYKHWPAARAWNGAEVSEHPSVYSMVSFPDIL